MIRTVAFAILRSCILRVMSCRRGHDRTGLVVAALPTMILCVMDATVCFNFGTETLVVRGVFKQEYAVLSKLPMHRYDS